MIEQALAERLDLPSDTGQVFFRPQGCRECRNTGYRGRIALQEIMVLDPEIRDLLNRGESSADRLENKARESGMTDIKLDAINKAKEGRSSLEEIMKAIFLGGL